MKLWKNTDNNILKKEKGKNSWHIAVASLHDYTGHIKWCR